MRQSILIRMVIFLTIYIGLRFYGGELGRQILTPIILLVTYLHELGHAVGSWVTGGDVVDITINKDGSGLTRTMGGSRAIILMGGYIGSAIFGNILFLIGARFKKLVKPTLLLLAISMTGIGFFLYSSMFTTGFLAAFSLFLIFVIWKTTWGREILMFLGLASILYIIQDFNIGPSSDLTKYAEIMKVLPANVWMYIWLAIALLLTLSNLRFIFKSNDDFKTEKVIPDTEDFLDMDAIT